jgi:hypothetical protein
MTPEMMKLAEYYISLSNQPDFKPQSYDDPHTSDEVMAAVKLYNERRMYEESVVTA